MKADLGGKDAQRIENLRANSHDFEIASNNFKAGHGVSLGF